MDYDFEAAAEAIYRWAGEESDRPVDPARLARAIGCEVERADRFASGRDGTVVVIGNRPVIYASRKLAPERTAHVVGHELGHLVCELDGYRGEDLEDVCDAIGAAVCMPRRAARLAFGWHGDDVPTIARMCVVTETHAWLRRGEVLGEPLAVVATQRVRVRGEPWAWPETEDGIRRLVCAPHPSVRIVTCTDEPRRSVLLAAI